MTTTPGGLAGTLAFGLGGAGTLTPAEQAAFSWLLSLYPPGTNDLYDVDTPASDVGAFFVALAQALAAQGPARVATLRTEVMPSTAVQKISDWEAALGLLASTNTGQRQAAVVGKLREQGASTLANVRAVIAPLLGYANSSALGIVESSRSALTTLDTYTNAISGTIAGGGSLTRLILVSDDGTVSNAGAQLQLVTPVISNLADVSVTLTGPDGTAVIWSTLPFFRGYSSYAGTLTLRSLTFAGKQINGEWTVTVSSSAGNVSWASLGLFVEGIGRYGSMAGCEGLGAQNFSWSILVDPTMVGVSSPTDYAAARRALLRIEQAHTSGIVALKMTGGATGAICDDPNAIVDACLCA